MLRVISVTVWFVFSQHKYFDCRIRIETLIYKGSFMRTYRYLGILVLLLLVLFTALDTPAHTQANATGTLNLSQQSCSGITIEFYYDGVTSDHTQQPPDHFYIRVENRTCAGPNCTAQASYGLIGEYYKKVPSQFGWITDRLTWAPVIPQGNGIEISVTQIGAQTGQPVGETIQAFFQCSDPAPCATCSNPAPCSTCGASSFLFHCTSSGVLVSSGGVAVLEASGQQIAGPLDKAVRKGENQFITSTNGVSLWALRSDELQVHYDYDPDATKLVVDSDICGTLEYVPSSPVYVPTNTQYTYTTTTTTTTAASTGGTYYVVQQGDNLFRIALRFGRTMDAIAAANGIGNYALIYAGQRLYIP